MPPHKNSGTVEGFLMKPPLETVIGKKLAARYQLAHHYYNQGGQQQVFCPVISYGAAAEWILDQDFRAGDMMYLDYKLKGMKYIDQSGFKKFGIELMGNQLVLLKKGKQHPEGGDEQFIGLPEGV